MGDRRFVAFHGQSFRLRCNGEEVAPEAASSCALDAASSVERASSWAMDDVHDEEGRQDSFVASSLGSPIVVDEPEEVPAAQPEPEAGYDEQDLADLMENYCTVVSGLCCNIPHHKFTEELRASADDFCLHCMQYVSGVLRMPGRLAIDNTLVLEMERQFSELKASLGCFQPDAEKDGRHGRDDDNDDHDDDHDDDDNDDEHGSEDDHEHGDHPTKRRRFTTKQPEA